MLRQSMLARLASLALLRLPLGRFPSRRERQVFADGFCSQQQFKASLVWGLLAVPTSRQGLLRLGEIAAHHLQAERANRAYRRFSDADGNFYTVWTGQPVSFLHIEKCGGSAFLGWLARQFHPEQINSDPNRDLPPHLFARLAARPVSQPLIWGHYDLPTLSRANPGRAVFTLLREPRARLLSLYDYWRSVDPANIDPDISFAVGAAHRLPLEDFLNQEEPCLVDSIDNIYVRRLTGRYATGAEQDPLRTAPDDALAAATDRLNQLFYVGITEAMDRSAAQLAALLGIAPPARGLRGNVTVENHQDPSGWFRQIGREPPSAAAQAALERRTALDRRLYAEVRARFEAL